MGSLSPTLDTGRWTAAKATGSAAPKMHNNASSELELPEAARWRRILRHPWLMPYNRLVVAVVLINAAIFAHLAQHGSLLSHGVAPEVLMRLSLLNFVVATVIRTQDVINILFRIATSVPKSWPIGIRWAAGKVYHFGGIHVGAYFSGAVFFVLHAVGQSFGPKPAPGPMQVLLWTHTALLVSIMIVALPRLRARFHDVFERVGRFGSWSSVALFWLQTLWSFELASALSLHALASSVEFYGLILISFCVALPWLRMRRVPVDVLTPSSHVAVACFDYGVTPFAGCSMDISRSPLLEWHPFATIATPGATGYRLTISRAGDWTGDFIDDAPETLWTRGIPAAGVGNIEKCFKRVIWVATGSGVGPCIPHLLAGNVPSRLIWSTRDPVRTYGRELVDEIMAAQPDALVWNTQAQGKPDLVRLAYRAYCEFEAEAVICIANKKLTWHVVHELESRGVPAFGAIWDS